MNQRRSFRRPSALLAIYVLVFAAGLRAAALGDTPSPPWALDNDDDNYLYLPIVQRPCGPGALRYNDDFSDPNSGWSTWDNDKSQISYLNDEFRLWVKVPNWRTGLASGSAGITSGYQLTADFRNVTGVAGSFGLMFGSDQTSQPDGLHYDLYTFEIGSSGDYYVYFVEGVLGSGSQWTLIHEGSSPSIRKGTVSSRLSVIHRPATIYVLANAQLLATLASDRTGAEQLGMMATSTTEPNLDVRVDNFEVREFNCDPDFGLGQP